jgi:hypothetical protein
MTPLAVTSLHIEREQPFLEISVILERRFRLEGVRLLRQRSRWAVLLPGEEAGHPAFFRPLGSEATDLLKRRILEAFERIAGEPCAMPTRDSQTPNTRMQA